MAVVRDKQGQLVEIAHARFESRGLVLLNMAGKEIDFQIANPKSSDAKPSTEALIEQHYGDVSAGTSYELFRLSPERLQPDHRCKPYLSVHQPLF